MAVYYNEIDPAAAAWLRELIKAGHIAPGDVDERSIEDVIPSELMVFTQCHFFAGIGVWSHALRQAGWPDDRPVWTGSCPCQPFSAAGKGGGTADERHLWPAFFWLIRQCRPNVVFGEQVEAALRHDWLDHVAVDLEAEGYTVGAVSSPACGYGAPHIRQRLYWVADSERDGGRSDKPQRGTKGRVVDGWGCPTRRVADADGRNSVAEREQRGGEQRLQPKGGGVVELADPKDTDRGAGERGTETGIGKDRERRRGSSGCGNAGVLGDSEERGLGMCGGAPGDSGRIAQPGPTNGFWSNAEWIPCRDGKARPTGRWIHPLVLAHTKNTGRRGAERTNGRCVSKREIKGDKGREVQHPNDGDANDGKSGWSRPVESSPLALADGPAAGMVHSGDQGAPADEIDPQKTAEARVMRLRGYGNAIVAPQAAAFIRSFMESK